MEWTRPLLSRFHFSNSFSLPAILPPTLPHRVPHKRKLTSSPRVPPVFSPSPLLPTHSAALSPKWRSWTRRETEAVDSAAAERRPLSVTERAGTTAPWRGRSTEQALLINRRSGAAARQALRAKLRPDLFSTTHNPHYQSDLKTSNAIPI